MAEESGPANSEGLLERRKESLTGVEAEELENRKLCLDDDNAPDKIVVRGSRIDFEDTAARKQGTGTTLT